MDIDRQDEDVVSHLTDAEIVSMVAPPTQEDDTGSGDEDVTNGEMEPPPVPTIKEAHAALDANVHAAQSAPKSETAADVTN